MKDPALLYDEDFVAWTEQQAGALRAAARGDRNFRRWTGSILPRRSRAWGGRTSASCIARYTGSFGICSKLQFSPAINSRSGWRESIRDGRMQADLVLADSPSLKPQLERFVAEETAKAIDRAIADLREYDEIDPAAERGLRATRYTVDQVFGDWFPSGSAPGSDGEG